MPTHVFEHDSGVIPFQVLPAPSVDSVAVTAAGDLHVYLSADGNDSGPGTEAEPWSSIARVNTEIQLYAHINRLVVHYLGAGTLTWDTPLNAGMCQEVVYVGRDWENVSDVLTVAAGSDALHVRLTASPGVETQDLMLRVESGAAAGQMRLIQGWRPRQPCRAATTGNITLSGTQTIDGIEVVEDDRVLVWLQNTATQNGIYLVRAGAWVRALDADNAIELVAASVVIEEGNTYADETFYQLADQPTIGSVAQEWSLDDALLQVSWPFGYSTGSPPAPGDTVRVVRPAAHILPALAWSSYQVSHVINGCQLVTMVGVEVDAGQNLGFYVNAPGLRAFGVRSHTNQFMCLDLQGAYPRVSAGMCFGVEDFSWMQEGYATSLNLSGVGLVFTTFCVNPWFEGILHAHYIFRAAEIGSFCKYTVYAGVLHGGTVDSKKTSIHVRSGELVFQSEGSSIPLGGQIAAVERSDVTLTTHSVIHACVFCDVDVDLMKTTVHANIRLSGQHQGYSSTGYAMNAEQGGTISLMTGNMPNGLRGTLADAHVAGLDAPLSQFTSGFGISDVGAPRGLGGMVVAYNRLTAGTAAQSRNVRNVSGASVAVYYGDDTLICDTSAGACSVQLPAPSSRYRALYVLRTSASNTLTLLRAGSELINGVAANYTAFTAGCITRIDSDGTNWRVDTGQGTGGDVTDVFGRTGSIVLVAGDLAGFPGAGYSEPVTVAAVDDVFTIDFAASNRFHLTLTANATIAFDNLASGQSGEIYVTQDGNGPWSLTFPTGATCLVPPGEDLDPFDTGVTHYAFSNFGAACRVARSTATAWVENA